MELSIHNKQGLLEINGEIRTSPFFASNGSKIYKIVSESESSSDIKVSEASEASVEYKDPGNYNFVVPEGVTSVNICMIGGGASGAVTYRHTSYGGKAGEIYTGAIPVTPLDIIPITIGSGGASIYHAGNNKPASYPGLAGEDTKFGVIVASGAPAGRPVDFPNDPQPDDMEFNGGETINCMGSFTHGSWAPAGGSYNPIQGTPYGGEAGFSNGVDARDSAGTMPNATMGSGGGSINYHGYYDSSRGSAGGNGYLKISWDV